MIEPLNIWRYISKNYALLKKDYNSIPLIFSFFVLPILISILIISFIESAKIESILNNSLVFFSIIIGFLINVLILILNKKDKYKDKYFNKKVETLKEHLGFNIINAIVFGILLVILILFYGEYNFSLTTKWFNLNVSEFLTLLLSTHFVMLLINIVRKFGVYVETLTKN